MGNTIRRKTIAILPSHPSQFWTMYAASKEMNKFANVVWILRNKDVIVGLAKHLGLDYVVLSDASRGLAGNLWEMFLNIFRCVKFSKKYSVDLWLTQYGSGNIAARLTGGKSICFNDDDIDNAPFATFATYPFCDLIVTPHVVRVGRFEYKRKKYCASHELFYLHPKRFIADTNIKKELGINNDQKYAIVRLVSLTSNHDKGIRGVSMNLMYQIIEMADKRNIKLFITSEKKLQPELEKYRLSVKPHKIHHVLAAAEFFLGDSQSMTSEAAVLGVPSFRINDFVGRISMIEVWEKYGLAFGFKPEQESDLLEKLNEVLDLPNYKKEFMNKRNKMIAEMEDPVVWFIKEVREILNIKTESV